MSNRRSVIFSAAAAIVASAAIPSCSLRSVDLRDDCAPSCGQSTLANDGATTETGPEGGVDGSPQGDDGGVDGGNDGGLCPNTGRGPRLVDIGGAYCIDQTEVTNAQYRAFYEAGVPTTGQRPVCAFNTTYKPKVWPVLGKDDYPVVDVDHCDAVAFCQWAGKRLCGRIGGGPVDEDVVLDPNKGQWMRACSRAGTRRFPYGEVFDGDTCNTSIGPDALTVAGSMAACVGGYDGVFDMSGNAHEWEDGCDGSTGALDFCSARGGSFKNSGATQLECSAVLMTATRGEMLDNVGIRCCWP